MAETLRSSASSSANKHPGSPPSSPSKKRPKAAAASPTYDRPNSEEPSLASRIDPPTADGTPELEKKTGSAPEQSSAPALSPSVCIAADTEQMGKSQPKVALGKLISQSSQAAASLMDDRPNSEEPSPASRIDLPTADGTAELEKKTGGALEQSSTAALSPSGCTSVDMEEMGKSQPKVAQGKLISQSLQFLTRNGLECSVLETICVNYPAVTYENVVKVVGFALSHHLKQNKTETPANEAKLVLSSESIEHGIRMLHATGWSCLPVDLLRLILLDFLPLRDAISFGAICKEWRSAFLSAKEKLWCHMPCLVIQKRKGRSSRLLSLALHALHGRGYKICPAVDELFNNFISSFIRFTMDQPLADDFFVSSSQGWLIVGSHKIQMVDVHNREFFHLPPLAETRKGELGFSSHRISKVVVVPSSSGRYDVVCMLDGPYSESELVVCQAGDKWANLEKPTDIIRLHLDDLNYHEGMVYAVTFDAKIFVWDLGRMTLCRVIPGPAAMQVNKPLIRKLYIVPTTEFELLLIGTCPDTEVQLFAFTKSGEWVQVSNLGKFSLFLGRNNQSMCLSKMDYIRSEMKENGIYITDPYRTGFHNIADGSFEPNEELELVRERLGPSDPLFTWRAAWIMPK